MRNDFKFEIRNSEFEIKDCHPERQRAIPKMQSRTRDLRVGAFYLLNFGKGEKSAECRMQS